MKHPVQHPVPTLSALSSALALLSGPAVVMGGPDDGPPSFTATVLPQLDPTHDPDILTYTTPSAINASGLIVGNLSTDLGFRWSSDAGGQLLQPIFPGATDAVWAAGINDAGSICGAYLPAGSFTALPFLLNPDRSVTHLPTLVTDLPCGASDLNESGLIVGSCETAPGGMFGGPSTAVYWLDGSVVEIGGLGGSADTAIAVNSRGVVAGFGNSSGSGPLQPFRWSQETGVEALPQFVAGVPSTPSDINDAGTIVGRGGKSLFENRPVYWDADGAIHELPTVEENPIDVDVLGINNHGVMVGHEIPQSTWEFEARLWWDGQAYRLQDLVVDLEPGVSLLRAVDINDEGQIAVEASRVVDGAVQFFTILLTPEPDEKANLITFVETFENGSNEGNWSFGMPNIEVIPREGGNPGPWLHIPCGAGPGNCLEFWYPMPSTTPMGDENLFTGNYLKRGVTSVGIDLVTHFYSSPGNDGPGHDEFHWNVAVILISDSGNPTDNSDNWGAYYVGEMHAPKVGEGWKSFDFEIPSGASDLPPGWVWNTGQPNAPADPSWSELMENVSMLMYSYLDPTLPATVQPWDVGLDNPRITYSDTKACGTGDLDCDGVVDVFDLLILLENWGTCSSPRDCPADLNGDEQVDVFDLLILLEKWG